MNTPPANRDRLPGERTAADDTLVLQALHVLRWDASAGKEFFGRLVGRLQAAAAANRLIVVNDDTGRPLGFAVWAGDAAGAKLAWTAAAPGRLAVLLRAVRADLTNRGILAWRRPRPDGGTRHFRWRRPRPVPEQASSPAEVLAAVWGRTQSYGYFDDTPRDLPDRIQAARRLLVERLEPREGCRYLAIASGMGATARDLAARGVAEAVGIEQTAVLVNRACEAAKEQPTVRFVHCDLAGIPEDLGLFDGAVCAGLSNRTGDTAAALAAIRRRLCPGARFVLADRATATAEDAPPAPSEARWGQLFARAGLAIARVEDWTGHAIATLDELRRAIEHLPAPRGAGHSEAAATVAHQRASMAAATSGWHVWTLEAAGAADLSLRGNPGRPVTLVMLSGGIDSAYALWETLAHTDHQVVAHHVHFANQEARALPEARACREIVSWLSEHVRRFDYRETGIEHRDMAYFGYDMISVGFEAGIAAHSARLRHNRAVDFWRIGDCLDEPGWPARWPHVLACCAAASYPHPPPAYADHPVIAKAEQVARMPRALALLTWGCRRPVWRDDVPFACGRCHTCHLRQRLGLA